MTTVGAEIRRQVGVPPALAARPLRTFRSRDAQSVYAHPRPQLARLERAGALHRLAHGYYVVVPQEYVGTPWMPTIEVAAAGISAALFGPREAALMSVSAARVRGALPRALDIAIIAAPSQHEPITLLDRAGTVRFVKRDITRLDVEPASTELGRALTTSAEQTVLDLARKPSLGVADDQISEALSALLPLCDRDILDRLAHDQHKQAALARARRWAR